MERELRELFSKLSAAEQEVRDAIGENRVEDAEKKMESVRALRKQIDLFKELETEPDDGIPITGSKGENKDRAELQAAYGKVFVKALRKKKMSSEDREIISSYHKEFYADVMHEGDATGHDDGDSSIIVPQDIQTRINEIMRELNDLSQFIRVERVNTLSGSRVLERDEDMVPFAVVDEYGEFQETDNPKFDPVTYKLIKRGGILPLTNELLADSDQNILQYVTNWLAKKHVVTRNTLIVNALRSLDPVALGGLDDLKQVLNVTLDPAISRSAIILTNQTGYNWLDTQKDEFGRYLLQDDITAPGQRLFKGRPVAVASNRHFPNDEYEGVAPFVVGNLQQLLVLFTRGVFELASTTVGGDAWRRDSTELKARSREDLVEWDENAAVFCTVPVEGS